MVGLRASHLRVLCLSMSSTNSGFDDAVTSHRNDLQRTPLYSWEVRLPCPFVPNTPAAKMCYASAVPSLNASAAARLFTSGDIPGV